MRKTASQDAAPMVLVVDDDITLRFLARESLEQAGFMVEEAEDGALVLAAFERLQPDIVLLDIDMPMPQVGAYELNRTHENLIDVDRFELRACRPIKIAHPRDNARDPAELGLSNVEEHALGRVGGQILVDQI